MSAWSAFWKDPEALSRVVVAGGLLVLGIFQPASRDLNRPWQSVADPHEFNLWKGWSPTAQEVKARLDAGATAVILDVRAKEAFAREHIEGALSMPWGEIEKGHTQLPKDRFILLYCT